LRLIERIFPLLPDDARVHQEWRKLVLSFGRSSSRRANRRGDAHSPSHAYFNFQHF
jgi:hypothetical protein